MSPEALTDLTTTSRGPLLDEKSLKRYLDERQTDIIQHEDERVAALQSWVASLATLRRPNEQALEQSFNTTVLCSVLGYVLHPAEHATAFPKPPTSLTRIGRTPDVALGAFTAADAQFIAVLELKKPGTSFDAPQARDNNETPVEQAFAYGRSLFGVRWVIVSDMLRMRLYSIDSETEFLEIDLRRAAETRLNRADFRRFYFLFSHECLVQGRERAPLSLLFRRSTARQLDLQTSFYRVYHDIRLDLLRAIEKAARDAGLTATREQCLQATQRLLDRLIFIHYCEAAPSNLLHHALLKRIVEAARLLPGSSKTKVYDALKSLFAEVDAGSSAGNTITIPGYNGELFKHHPIIDVITLPDTLHDKAYAVTMSDGTARRVSGAWGLHEFDFWHELNEHLLGRIFEESLSDFHTLEGGVELDLAARVRERRRHGIYYTTEHLADFLARGAVAAHLSQSSSLPPAQTPEQLAASLEGRLAVLSATKICDLACGSGAFLVGAYHSLLLEAWRCNNGINTIRNIQDDLFTAQAGAQRKALLRNCVFGVDLLPQAVEIAKLALWIRSAHRGEKVANLDRNIFSGDSLRMDLYPPELRELLGRLDIVVGNPPWGSDLSAESARFAIDQLGLDTNSDWDSWEIFLALTIHCLKDGGRLALVLPDTLFSPEKAKARKLLLEKTQIEKLHSLGPDWFGPGVRMGAVVVQARKGTAAANSTFKSLLLYGSLRRKAIMGEIPLEQLEASFARDIPQDRCRQSEGAQIEVFRSVHDDLILAQIESSSISLSALCEHGRGEEISKSGLLWRCPSCGRHTTPGRLRRGGGFESKPCPHCDLELNAGSVVEHHLVTVGSAVVSGRAFFIDGDDISNRYGRVTPNKTIDTSEDVRYKDASLYASPKLLIRQAGVGISATLDNTGSVCPQSVYVYRLTGDALAQGYKHEFLLAVLLSRTMAYVVFKKFSEVDAARAFAKVTHARLQALPVPKVDFQNARHAELHASICSNVAALLSGDEPIGRRRDLEIEQDLRELWAVTPEDGMAINMELAVLPATKALQELAPLPARGITIEE